MKCHDLFKAGSMAAAFTLVIFATVERTLAQTQDGANVRTYGVRNAETTEAQPGASATSYGVITWRVAEQGVSGEMVLKTTDKVDYRFSLRRGGLGLLGVLQEGEVRTFNLWYSGNSAGERPIPSPIGKVTIDQFDDAAGGIPTSGTIDLGTMAFSNVKKLRFGGGAANPPPRQDPGANQDPDLDAINRALRRDPAAPSGAPPASPPPPPPGAAVVGVPGVLASTGGQLTANDTRDRERTGSFAKVDTFEFQAGASYVIDVVSNPGLGYFDPWLRIEDAAGRTLANDDDSGGNLNARITFRPTATGSYRLVVTSYHGGATGNYTLTIRR